MWGRGSCPTGSDDKILRVAHAFLHAFPSQERPRLSWTNQDEVIEYDFGWVFYYNAKEYLETNDMELGLTGNAPLIVDRNDGQLYITGTAYPIEHYLDQYRKGVRTRAHV